MSSTWSDLYAEVMRDLDILACLDRYLTIFDLPEVDDEGG